MSLKRPTERSFGSQSGSTRTPASTPSPIFSSPRRRAHGGLELDMLPDPERVRAAGEVIEEYVLGREVQRPVVPLRERVAVVVIGIVDAATWIAVLQPCPADVVVLFEDDERDAGLLQTVRGEQARHPGADDHHPEVEVGREVVLAP